MLALHGLAACAHTATIRSNNEFCHRWGTDGAPMNTDKTGRLCCFFLHRWPSVPHRWLLLLILLSLLSVARAEAPATLPALFDPARHMRVSEVRDGMRGYGLSVFKGTKIERFDVEVMSVLRAFN